MLNYFIDFYLHLRSLVTPHTKRIKYNIPYFSQWESPELVDQILQKTVPAAKDPNWKNSGAESPQDYEYWSWNLCGMACLKMILMDKLKIEKPVVSLGKKCAEYGGYIPREKTIDGLFYKPFIPFIKNEFNLRGVIAKFLTVSRIKYELNKGNYVIASVNPNIRDTLQPTPPNKAGHLVLVVGYDEAEHVLYLHNPSGFYKKSQRFHQITEPDFKRFFAGKGIVIYNST